MKNKLLKIIALIFFFHFSSFTASATIYYVTNVNDTGAGSLRQAIIDANTHPWLDTIYFNITGSAPYVIHPITIYPEIASPVLIDGFSQPLNNDTTYSVIIDGSSFTDPDNIITIKSSLTEFRGLKFANSTNVFFYLTANPLFSPAVLQNVRFRRNIFENSTRYIFIVTYDSDSVHDVLVDSNSFFKASGCMLVEGESFLSTIVDGVTITNNVMDSTAAFEFFADGTGSNPVPHTLRNFTLENNVISNCYTPLSFHGGGTGNFTVETSALLISQNTFKNITSDAIHFNMDGTGNLVYKISNVSILKNLFDKISACAVSLYADGTGSASFTEDSISIDSNDIKGIYSNGVGSFAGISLSASGTGSLQNAMTNLSITNNIIDSVKFGIYFGTNATGNLRNSVKYGYILRNTIKDVTTGLMFDPEIIASVQSAFRYFSISENSIFNCNQYGIEFLNYTDFLTVDRIDYFTILNNSIHDCDSDGINFYTQDFCGSTHVFLHQFSINHNTIYHNGKFGIHLYDMSPLGICAIRKTQLDHNIFSENSIYDNGDRGIKITDLADTINFNGYEFPIPILDTMFYSGGQYYISGHLNGEHATGYKLEYFLNTTADTSGYGEGETFIGNDSVHTDSTGFVSFIYAVSNVAGACIAATATDYSHYNTSEFGNCLPVNLVGLHEYSPATFALAVFPNPAKDVVMVKGLVAPDAILTIYDNTGRLRLQQPFSGKATIGTGALTSGVYFIEVTSPLEKPQTGKLFIVR